MDRVNEMIKRLSDNDQGGVQVSDQRGDVWIRSFTLKQFGGKYERRNREYV